MDPSQIVAQNETFFFEQRSSRRLPKRYRKQPEDLPHDLRFAHLNPRVAAYLASKEKDQKIPGEFDDGLGNKSLLPQINQTVTLIRHRLDSILSNDSDTQRALFEETKSGSPGILIQLARILYLFDGLKVHLPTSLEHQLLCGWKELITEAKYTNRVWQIPANKETHEKSQKSELSSKGEEGKDSEVEEEGKTAEGRRTRSKMTRSTTLPGPREDSLEGRGETMVRVVEPDLPNLMASKNIHRKMSATPKSRSGSTKHRASIFLGDTRERELRPGSAAGSRSSLMRGKSGVRHEDAMSVLAESTSDGTRSAVTHGQPSFVQTIQFQLSSKLCDERGWIVHPGSNDEKEWKNAIEWCTQRLQVSVRHKADEKLVEEELGMDQQSSIRFYGDGQKEQLQKYKGKSRDRINTALYKGHQPKIPSLPDGDGRPVLVTTVADGSTTVFYPNGRPAIITSRSLPGKPGYYTFVYDNTPEQKLLATFTPSGRGCSYHENGVVNFLANETGGTMSEPNGGINKRWPWPSQGAKLPVTIVVQLNSCVLFKCNNQSQMTLYFTSQREQVKFHVGVTPGAEDVPSRDDMGHLQTGTMFSSQASREFARPYKPKMSTSKTRTKSRGKSKSPVPASEIQKLLADLPVDKTENDADADKELIKIHRKIKLVTEDWLEHYRMAVGMMSPQLKSMRDGPNFKKSRNNSAKSSPAGGGHVIIETAGTQIATASVSYRAPSAPVSRSNRPQSATSDDRASEQQLTVKFDEKPPEAIDILEQLSQGRITPFPSTMGSTIGSIQASRGKRTKSAPLRLSTTPGNTDSLGPSTGLCTVALRMSILGEEGVICRCSRHHIPVITDIEYDMFIDKQLPASQLLIVSIISSIFPETNHGREMLDSLHADQNRNRARPCMQSRADSYRILLYDIATAAQFSNHSEPMLLRRHNVVPGMFLMYQGGKLVFCDHIFNGYGNERKDLQKQMMVTRRTASLGQILPKDFRFSPQHGRHGLRSAWGGEIGGTGVDHYGNPGLSLNNGTAKKSSMVSLDSVDSNEVPYSFQISGVDNSLKVMRKSLNAAAYNQLPSSPRARPSESLHPELSTSLPQVHITRAPRRAAIKAR